MAKTTTTTAPVAAPVAGEKSAPARPGTWDLAIKAIKAGMAADTRKLNTLDKARAALLDTRVTIVRDTAYAMTFKESHATAGKTAGQPSQSVIAEALGINRLTFAPYFKAASELYAKFPELETEPGRAISEQEREHVASFWKAEALRAKARREAAAKKADAPKSGEVEVISQGDADGGEGGTGAGVGTDGRTSPVTVDSVKAAVALLAKTLTDFAESGQGFSKDEAAFIGEALASAGTLVEGLTA